jgi:hypothetical protein
MIKDSLALAQDFSAEPFVPAPEYRPGRTMSREPANMTWAQAMYHLCRIMEPVTVVLEPGDGTRYDLTIQPITNGVNRIEGCGDTSGMYSLVTYAQRNYKTILIHLGNAQFEATNLTDNEWSQQVLGWWLAEYASEMADTIGLAD